MRYGEHVPDGHKIIWVCNDPEMEEYGEVAFGCVDGGIEYIRSDIARAEITQLRAELEQERELADRLSGLAERAQYALKQVLAGKPVRDADEIIASLSALAPTPHGGTNERSGIGAVASRT